MFKKFKNIFEDINVDAARSTARFVAICLMGGVIGGLIIEFLPTWLILLSMFFVIIAIVYRLEKIELDRKQNDQEPNQ